MSTLAIDKDDFSILSEFADGGDLRQFLVGGFTGFRSHRDRIIEEMMDLADALHFLHTGFRVDGEHRPCYHLDLKPANVLIFNRRHCPPEKRDGVGKWVITDFGFSVLHEHNAEGASKTFPRREAGTFQPPEVDERLGLPRVNAKGDIWSLGGILCMIVRALTCRKSVPFLAWSFLLLAKSLHADEYSQLAFLVDGSRGVDEHIRQRTRTATGLQEQDFYYVIQQHHHGPKAILKPKIRDWLNEIRDSSPDVVWIDGMIRVIRQCLTVDEHDRPDAVEVYSSLLQLRSHNEPRIQANFDPPPSSSRPEPPPPVPLSAPGHGRSRLSRLIHRRTESRPTASRFMPQLQPGTRSDSFDSVTPTSPPSTGSAPSVESRSGSVETLLQREPAKHVAVEPNGHHIVLCCSREAYIFDLIMMPGTQMQRYLNSRERSVTGTFDYINLAGHYLILYEKTTMKARRLVSCYSLCTDME